MSNKIKILLVEDNEVVHEVVGLALGDKFIVVSAFKVEQATVTLKEDPNIKAVIFDGFLEQGNTLELIGEVASSDFSGYMIASSTDEDMRNFQMKAGCHLRCNYKIGKINELVELMNSLVWPRRRS